MASGFQVMKFVMVDCDKNWNRQLDPNAVVQYTATANGATLAVALEGPTGVVTTYRYTMQANDVAYILEDVIHVAGRCQKQEPGNTIKCG
jgi:hypothetical protein